MSINKQILNKITSKTKIYLVIIAILLIVLSYYQSKFVIPSIVFYTVLIIYTFWTNSKKKSEFFKHMQEFNLDVDSAAKNTLINSPFPLIIIQTDGSIIWKNSKFVQEFINININSYLNEITKELRQDILNGDKTKKAFTKEININNKSYYVIGEYVKNKYKEERKYIVTLYFIDDTERIQLEKKYFNEKVCVGLIMVDNYDEIIQKISSEMRPQITATIEKEIYSWASVTGGLVVKKEKDTFVFLMDQQGLQKIEEEKFNILDKIKEIEIDVKWQLTLSIAVAEEGNSLYEKYETALQALDIALGRGGDQAVVRRNGNYVFYGGRTLEVEKRTRVKARIVAHALEELMNEAKNVIVMGHANSDIDCIGSSLGIYRLAKSLGKEVNIVNITSDITLDNFLSALKEEDEYKNALIDKSEALDKTNKDTLLIVLDTHRKNYVEVPELLEKTNKIVVIDHHRKSTEFIENPILIFHEVYASSTAELVIEILQYTGVKPKLTDLEVESLYGGIMVDTKDFTFKTGVRTFEAAAYLRKLGVDIIKVKKWFQIDLENYNVIAEIVKNTEVIDGNIGIAVYEEVDKNAGLICAKTADELLTISDISASFVIGNDGNKICISGRSIGDINVQVILEKLGGGGHITVAGAQLKELSLNEAKKMVIEKIQEYLDEN